MSSEDLTVRLGLDSGGFASGVASMMKSLGGFKSALLGIAGITAAGFAVDSAQDLEASLFRIRANARESVGSLAALSESVRLASSEALRSAFSQNQVAEALAGVVNEAENAGEALKIVTAAGRLAAISGEDLSSVSDELAKVLSLYGLEAEDAAKAAQVLFEAGKQTGTGLDELGSSMKSIAPLARGLGFSFEESAALAGVLRDAGVDSADALLGAWSKAGGSGGLPGLLALIDEKMKEAAATGRTAGEVLGEAFGVKGAKAALALANGVADLDAVLTAARSPVGDFVAGLEDNVSASTRAKNQFSQITTTLGEQLLPTVNVLLGAFSRFFDFLSRAGLTDEFARSVVAVAGAFVVLKLALWAGTAAASAFGFAAAPITITVLGIAAAIALGVLVWKNWDKIVSFVGEKVDNFKLGLQVLWAKLSPLRDALDAVGDAFVRVGEAVVAAAKFVVDIGLWVGELELKILRIGASIVAGIVDGVRNGFQAVREAVADLGRAIVDRFKAFFGISSPSKVFMDLAVWLVKGFAVGIVGAIPEALDAVGSLFDQLLAKAKELGQRALDFFAGIGRGLVSGITGAFGQAKDFLGGVVNAVTGGGAGTQNQVVGPVQAPTRSLGSAESAAAEIARMQTRAVSFLGFKAHGFDGIVNGPSLLGVGEAGPERVTVTPLSRSGASSTVFNVTINAPTGDADKIADVFQQRFARSLSRLGIQG